MNPKFWPWIWLQALCRLSPEHIRKTCAIVKTTVCHVCLSQIQSRSHGLEKGLGQDYSCVMHCFKTSAPWWLLVLLRLKFHPESATCQHEAHLDMHMDYFKFDNLSDLKGRHTIGNCQRPVFSLGVSHHSHKITILWKFGLNQLSKLRENEFVCFQIGIKDF